ncbi:hemerythrin domain-containing protein [Nonomuraea sp. NPDC003214]
MALDFTMMNAMHDALRRELERLARVAARAGDEPRRVLAAGAGWSLFKRFLTVHHTAEDEALWPPMRAALAARPDDLLLLDAMEAEHAAIDPLLGAVDAALADRDHGAERLAGLIDELATGLRGHLRHEEADGLALVDAVLTAEQWAGFGAAHRHRIGHDDTTYLPWVLDGRADEAAASILDGMPDEIRVAYRDDWRPAFDRLDLYAQERSLTTE